MIGLGRRISSLAAALLLAAALGAPAPSLAGEKKPELDDKAAPAALKDAGIAFESARLLEGAARVSALQELDQTVGSVLHGDLDDEEYAAARALSAQIHFELGDYDRAAREYRGVAEQMDKNTFRDDAEFASIRALEWAGQDLEAAKQWAQWEKDHPNSPLRGEAQIAQAWNALRRGEAALATKQLALLSRSQPWSDSDPRVTLAKATLLYQQSKPLEAIAALGPKATGPAAGYLRGLCYRTQGAVLQSAAAFQEVADRYPDSPLRDPAMLAKADAFLLAKDYRSATEEFSRVARKAKSPNVVAEAEVRGAGALFLAGSADSALVLLRGIVEQHPNTDAAARAQFLVGEILVGRRQYAEAIVELNHVLKDYFQHSVAASAQYQVGRCLDALGRKNDATGSYQAVVSGYPLEPEAPAAAYLAGVGLLAQNKPRAAATYFQIVLDRYSAQLEKANLDMFRSPERLELVDAALCLLLYSYHKAGDLGQLAGAPHALLQKMPPSHSSWRAYALLIDADASAAQARYPEAQTTLERLMRDFPNHPIGASATKLLAWSYARQGRDSLAIATEEGLVARYGSTGRADLVASAYLDIAHDRFNQKNYRAAADAYALFLKRFPKDPKRLQAHYQAGLACLRSNRAGDAVDHWEAIVKDSSSAPIAEKAWARAGDVYFQAQRYEDAKRCYRGLLEHFAETDGVALAMLRLGQCEYNAGNDAAALSRFSETIARFPDTPYSKEAQRGSELALYRLGQTPKGKTELAKLVEQYPTSSFAADALFQIAKSDYQAKRWNEAADGFRRVVSQFPGYSAADEAQFLLADAYTKAGNLEQARLAYEQFLAFFPSSELRPTAEFQVGLQYFQAKDYMRAAVSFTQVLGESASTEVRAASRYNLALCQRELGQPDDAKATLLKYRDDFPNDKRADEVAYQLADLLEASGHPAEAMDEFQRALNSRPSPSLEVELQYRMGHNLEQQSQIDGALKAYNRAAASTDRRNPYRLSALARCAAIYEARKDYVRALYAYRDIAQNSKDSELAAAAAGRASQLESRGGKKR
jgi:TolA-binding protein